jgi:hypothetical protein
VCCFSRKPPVNSIDDEHSGEVVVDKNLGEYEMRPTLIVCAVEFSAEGRAVLAYTRAV